MKRFLSIVALLALGWPLLAQPLPGPGRPRPDSLCPPECHPEPRERQMLEAVRITRMTEALNLSQDQTARFFPKLKQLEDDHRQMRRRHRELVARLEEMMQRKVAEKDLRSRLDSIDRLRQESMMRMERIHRELDTILTLEQRARWRVFEENFDDEIRRMVMQAKEKRFRRTNAPGNQ